VLRKLTNYGLTNLKLKPDEFVSDFNKRYTKCYNHLLVIVHPSNIVIIVAYSIVLDDDLSYAL